jgi:UDP-N-acetylmuramyl tripeptide synthase
LARCLWIPLAVGCVRAEPVRLAAIAESSRANGKTTTVKCLEARLRAIRAASPNARVTTLFGCGADRDRTKRLLMGAAVRRYSDHAIVTSDNPRFEVVRHFARLGGGDA